MILTNRFVLLNYPRTGSTFVREALRTIYGQNGGRLTQLVQSLRPGRPRLQELLLPIDRTTSALLDKRKSQHGAYSQIPASHRGLPVLSVTRHPLDRVISQYEHGFWRDHPLGELKRMKHLLPTFPDLTFSDYLKLQATFGFDAVRQDADVKAVVGACTLHFIRFFFPDPDAALARLTDESIDSGEFLRGMPEIHFLRTEDLVAGLRAFLHSVGFDREETAFLVDKPRVNRALSRGERTWSDYFSPSEASQYRQRNRLLFQMFPEYDD